MSKSWFSFQQQLNSLNGYVVWTLFVMSALIIVDYGMLIFLNNQLLSN